MPRTGYRLLAWRRACRRQGNADLLLLVDAGRGDVLLIELALPVHQLPFTAHRLRGDRRRLT
jgi:hypothetical protein